MNIGLSRTRCEKETDAEFLYSIPRDTQQTRAVSPQRRQVFLWRM